MTEVYALRSGDYYQPGEGISFHMTYAGAQVEAGRWLSEPDYQDPYGIATRTSYHRVPPIAGELDRWHNDGNEWILIECVEVNG